MPSPPLRPRPAPRAIASFPRHSRRADPRVSTPHALALAQKAAFLCQAKCADMRGPQEEMHRCLQQCGEPIARHEAAVMGELQQFQQRIQRCVVQCQDKQAGQTTPDTKKYEKCVSECAVFYQKELAQLKPKLLKKP